MEITNVRLRAPRGTITREDVVGAAARAVQAGQFENMTIRGLASELGVAPMSLYRHVRDKDDILDEVVDWMLARRWRPRADRADWVAWTTEAAERLRDFLVTQPAALHVYLRHPVVSPAAIARMQAVLEVLHDAGFVDEAAQATYAAVHTYTIGFAALEASRASSSRRDAEANEISKQLASFTTKRQFSIGLAYLLGGIDQQRTTASR